jgi:hypothetical protein
MQSVEATSCASVSGRPMRRKRMKPIGWPAFAAMPAATTLPAAPITVALPPSVAPNIMPTKTGSRCTGQLEKPAPSASSGTASISTR